jgi:flagellar biosynthetic protein FliR
MDEPLAVFLAVLCRWTPMFLAVGNGPMHWFPAQVRLVLLLICAVFSWQQVYPITVTSQTYITEFTIGLLLMFELKLMFAALSFWGRLLDQQIGFMAAGMFNPASNEQEPLTGSIILLGATVTFFVLGLHYSWLNLVVQSFLWLPIGTSIEAGWFWRAALSFGWLFILSIGLFLPVIVGLWLFDICSALLSRTLPQMNIYFVAMPLKILLGLLLLAASVTLTDDFVSRLNERALQLAYSLFSV